MRIIIIIVMVILLIMLFRINKAMKLERRIGRYSTYSLIEESVNLMDIIANNYNHFVNKLEKNIADDNRFKKVSKKYNKYVLVGDSVNPVRFIINKLIIGGLFVVLLVISFAIRGRVVNVFLFIFSFIVGYYAYDVYLIVNNKIKIKKIKNDMLRVVIVMNNCFKAGKSIMQAVDVVRKELPNPISGEFDKIYQDMLYGLSADVVFERFASRVSLEEVRYISSSLTILNQTGGNIVNVFNSIEKTLFDKKRLDEELKNATAASNLVVKVLMFIPIVFVLFICIVSPGYFEPLFSSVVGYFVLLLMAIMFVVFIVILKRIMKVKV